MFYQYFLRPIDGKYRSATASLVTIGFGFFLHNTDDEVLNFHSFISIQIFFHFQELKATETFFDALMVWKNFVFWVLFLFVGHLQFNIPIFSQNVYTESLNKWGAHIVLKNTHVKLWAPWDQGKMLWYTFQAGMLMFSKNGDTFLYFEPFKVRIRRCRLEKFSTCLSEHWFRLILSKNSVTCSKKWKDTGNWTYWFHLSGIHRRGCSDSGNCKFVCRRVHRGHNLCPLYSRGGKEIQKGVTERKPRNML